MLWQAALILGPLDAAFITVLARRIAAEEFARMKLGLVVTTALFWFLVWGAMSVYFWEGVYHYVFPAWARWFVPPVYGLLFASVVLLMWSVAMRLPWNRVVSFCLLGGLWGAITHMWAIVRGILERPPLLQGVSPIAAVVMPMFEFILYWCLIVSIASCFRRRRARVRQEQTAGECRNSR